MCSAAYLAFRIQTQTLLILLCVLILILVVYDITEYKILAKLPFSA